MKIIQPHDLFHLRKLIWNHKMTNFSKFRKSVFEGAKLRTIAVNKRFGLYSQFWSNFVEQR